MPTLWCENEIYQSRYRKPAFSSPRNAGEYNRRCIEMASNVDSWLTFFKGQLSLHDIRDGMSYKRLMSLIEARSKRMIEEQKALESQTKR